MKFVKLFGIAALCLFAGLPSLWSAAHEGGPHVRVAHLSPSLQPVDVYIGGALMVKALKFKDASNYLALEGSSFDFVITPAGSDVKSALNEKPISLAFDVDEGTFYTLALVGSPQDKTLDLVKLPADKGGEGQATTPEADHGDEHTDEVGTASSGNIKISGAFARPTMTGQADSTAAQKATPEAMAGMNMGGGATSAAYMLIQNTGDQPDRLLSVTCDVAEVAEVHQTIVKDNVAQMQPIDGIDIAAHDSVELKPGGYHVMLMKLKQGLMAGQTISLTLTFQSGTKVTVKAAVKMP
jgi:copper(I)-binding protein